MFSELPENERQARPRNKKEQFLDTLPEKFNRQQYLEVAKNLGITIKTASGYMAGFCQKGLILHDQHDCYINLSVENSNPTSQEPDEG